MKRLVLLLWLIALPAFAVEPGEILPDPALEARARDISAGLRCLVCQNESIDESHADLARDLRLLVRERLVAGDTDAEVVAFVTSRYGEYVLLKPSAKGANLLLWIAGPLMLLVALGVAFPYLRRRSTAPADELTEAERARLEELTRG
jgi:cytochrome c-type biogenesis protein CcmH